MKRQGPLTTLSGSMKGPLPGRSPYRLATFIVSPAK